MPLSPHITLSCQPWLQVIRLENYFSLTESWESSCSHKDMFRLVQMILMPPAPYFSPPVPLSPHTTLSCQPWLQVIRLENYFSVMESWEPSCSHKDMFRLVQMILMPPAPYFSPPMPLSPHITLSCQPWLQVIRLENYFSVTESWEPSCSHKDMFRLVQMILMPPAPYFSPSHALIPPHHTLMPAMFTGDKIGELYVSYGVIGTSPFMQLQGHVQVSHGDVNVCPSPKLPCHAIIPAMVTDEKIRELCVSYGLMGTFMQPQGHDQVS